MPTQDYRFGFIATPLGKDVLLFSRMKGYEEMSRLFEYELDLLSEKKRIDVKDILGQSMSLAIELPAGGTRYYHGVVTQFKHHGTEGEFFLYRAVLRPWLWFLTRRSDCRIFQELSVPDIIKKVFQFNGFSDFKVSLSQTYKPRDYCVQYRETDFNFVSRLLESEGIYYFFTHEQGKHTLVIADSVTAYQTVSGYQDIVYFPPENKARRDKDHIFEWHNSHEVQAGSYELNDFDFEKPKANLQVKCVQEKSHAQANRDHYDYPGNYTETSVGENYAADRLNELQSQHALIRGRGNAMGISTGMTFTLKNHYIEQENSKHVVTTTDFFIESNQYRSDQANALQYDCSFIAIPFDQQFRPRRLTPVPFVQGPQTAIVVGKQGEEIWTDKYGRVKVQFHWDREGEYGEKSSCWVRVSHPMAGKNWGWISLPRIGQEVIVSFLEGNPDRPIITGRVYNADQMPPYPLPAEQTKSGIKTRSSKNGSTDNFNEFRFEDKKGEEQVFLHAERNQDIRVKKDRFEWIGNEKHLIVKKDYFEQVDGDSHSTVKGDRNEAITGTLSIKASQDMQEKVGMKHALDAGMEIHLKAGMNVVIEAGMSITLKAAGSFVMVGPTGVTISGPMVLINSGGSAGSGSGCSPDPAKPPKEAANSKGGDKSTLPPKKRPAKPKTYSPAALVLKQAAQNGTPFCEKCEQAKKAKK